MPLTVDAQGKKTARVIKRVSCRERKGHKREEKDSKDGENGKEDSARRKQSVREMLKSSEWEDYIEIHRKQASEGRHRGLTAVAWQVFLMQV